ncbi:hypothetical protein HJC23_010874 [Cyclotella cryptica]|uniref:Uncharacterized protein n=1 Tax=Cyclotella cryptica TaxID=29204 RepID=A0ABD3QP78_9STRA
MGPGDRFMKWKLHAKMMIDSSIPVGVGSLVYHPKNEGSSAAIITQVDQVDDKNKRMCTLASFGTGPVSPIKYELSELRPFDGTIKFHVRCMNVQGGGVLCHKHMGREAFSMKWLDPVTEKMDEPDGFHDGCWYFDPTQQLDPADLVDDQQVHQLRREFSEMIDKNETAALKELISKMLFEKLKERNTGGTWIIAPFQRVLLSVPFLIYTDIVLYFLECLQNKVAEGEIDDLLVYDGGLVVYSLVKVGVYLHHDKEWHSANSKLEAFITSQSDDPIEVLMDSEIHKTINVAGEWFEDNEEFRAAVWCYSINLANLRNANVMSWLPTEERNHLLIDLLNYIALANKRMDNFVDAYKYYEEAIVMYNSMSSPRQTQPLIKNAKQMQTTAGAWFGTSATIPSWKSSEMSSRQIIAQPATRKERSNHALRVIWCAIVTLTASGSTGRRFTNILA